MKNRLKLTKSSTIGYLLILVGLLFITIPLTRRTINDYSARQSQKKFEKLQNQRDKAEVEEENANAKEYNQTVRDIDITL